MTAQTSGAHAAIDAINQKWVEAYNRGDAAGVAALYTKDGQLLPAGSPIATGTDGVAAYWTAAMEMGVKKVALKRIELDHQGPIAVEVGRVTLYAEDGEVIDEPKYLIVWRHEDGQWKLHRDIWNSDKA